MPTKQLFRKETNWFIVKKQKVTQKSVTKLKRKTEILRSKKIRKIKKTFKNISKKEKKIKPREEELRKRKKMLLKKKK